MGHPACPLPSGCGAFAAGGSIEVHGSVLANASDCDGSDRITTLGHNIVTDQTCEFGFSSDHEDADPLLGPLADNGGPTPTHAPATGSPAIDAVPTGTSGLCDGTVTTDQRGVPRPVGSGCDIGALEQ
ncbi:MAG: choice-of-anchor Q domain-containing protein [Acidimicrobiia bacterium]|nr:choice-of-anchor Q domain-containing protein [Acidimicrobiia bacterium]